MAFPNSKHSNHKPSKKSPNMTGAEQIKAKKVFRPAIATMSLGKPGIHPLNKKLEAAATLGFQGVELFWDDLVAHAKQYEGSVNDINTPSIVIAGRRVKELCDRFNLTVISLQPFRNYDGITDEKLHNERLEEFKVWLSVAHELGAGCIGVPSTIEPNPKTHTGRIDVIAKDLAELAQLARPYNVRIAYENLCFGAHIRSWAQAWKAITKSGQTDVVGFLPDTFNLCGNSFADPAVRGGISRGGLCTHAMSLDLLKQTIPASSFPLLQVADAELMDPPLKKDHPWAAGCRNAKMAWSRNARLYPFEKNSYLPIVGVIEAVVATGWSGWVSMELFSRTTAKEGEMTIWEHAQRGWDSWEKLAEVMKWDILPNEI